MIKPLVSVIIPVYNAEGYLAQTIASAKAQTLANIEIVIIDDGSTDGSLALAKKHQSETIKVFSRENKGASAARNLGLKMSCGEYIQFLDADDLLSANKIEEQVRLLMLNPGYVALCRTSHFFDGEDPLSHPPIKEWYEEGSDDPVDFLIKLYGGSLIGEGYGGMIQPNAWLTPRDLIDKAGPWNEMRNPDDDGEFFCRVILASKGIKYAADATNYYRKFKETSTWSAQKSYAACKSMLQSTRLKASHLLAKTNDPRAKVALGRLLWDHAYNFYPAYKDLALEAEQASKELAPGFNYNPFHGDIKYVVSYLFGWKMLRKLQNINLKISRIFKKS